MSLVQLACVEGQINAIIPHFNTLFAQGMKWAKLGSRIVNSGKVNSGKVNS